MAVDWGGSREREDQSVLKPGPPVPQEEVWLHLSAAVAVPATVGTPPTPSPPVPLTWDNPRLRQWSLPFPATDWCERNEGRRAVIYFHL